jgi:hypothetical protein
VTQRSPAGLPWFRSVPLRGTLVDAEPVPRGTLIDAEPVPRGTFDHAEPVLRRVLGNADLTCKRHPRLRGPECEEESPAFLFDGKRASFMLF